MDVGTAVTLSATAIGLIAGCVQVADYLEKKREARRKAAHLPPGPSAPAEIVLAPAAPALQTNAPPSLLPAQTTSFIGRDDELTELARLLTTGGAARLVTVTGTGGCGKTRLALQAAQQVRAAFPGGTWWCDLSALRDGAQVAPTVAAALNAFPEGAQTPTEAVCRVLDARHALLLLDNCEHLLDSVCAFTETLLQTCPAVCILATSREDLDAHGEHVFPLSPLPVPGADAPPGTVGKSAAVRLFVERARAEGGHFVLSDGNADVVARICRRLDGLPLALELAGARVRTLSLEQIAGRLEDRFRFLTGGARTASVRQQTLQATVDWSFNLLSEKERALFGQVAVFVGGWTLDAAEAVCGGLDVLDTLSELVDKSLVTADNGEDGPRFRLLETLHAYSLEHPATDADAVRVRHRAFYTELAAQAEPHLRGPAQAHWLRVLEREHDNLRAALAASDTAERLRLGTCLHKFWLARGLMAEGRGWLDDALSAPDANAVDPAVRAAALSASGVLAWASADYMAAQKRQTDALALFHEQGNTSGAAKALVNLGIVADYRKDYDAARPLYEESLALFRAERDDWNAANVLLNLGAHCVDQGHLEDANTFLRESLRWFEAQNDRACVSVIHYDLGQIAMKREQWHDTQAELGKSLVLRRELDDVRGMADCLFLMACADAALKNDVRAARGLGAAAALRDQVHGVVHENYPSQNEQTVALLTERMGASLFAHSLAEGHAGPIAFVTEEVTRQQTLS